MVKPDDEGERTPWRERRFVVFASGNFVNNIGEQVFRVALPLLVYELTGSLLVMSMLTLVQSATMLLGPVLGVVVDRFGPRVLVVPGLLAQLAGAALLNLFALAGHASRWPLFALALCVELGGECYRTGWMAGVATMFPANPVRSRGSLNTLFVISRTVGPMLVAAALGPVGYLGLLWLNVATFLAPIGVWLMGVYPPRQEYRALPDRRGPYHDLLDGWRILRRQPAIWYGMLVTLPLNFVGSTATMTLAIFYLRSGLHLPAQRVSTVLVIVNLGALVGAVLVAERKRLRVRRTMTITAIGMAGTLLAMTAPSVWLFAAALLLFYLLRQSMAVASMLMIFKYVPARLVGRATGIVDLIAGVPSVAAPLLVPFLEPVVGARATFGVLGLIAALSVVCLVVSWRRWTEQATARQPSAAPP